TATIMAARDRRTPIQAKHFMTALDQPRQTAGDGVGRPTSLPCGQASNRGLIFGVKFRRTKCWPDADARTLTDPDIPDGLVMARDLPMQVRRARAGHVVHYRTISSDSATDFSGTSGIRIDASSPIFTSISVTPAFLAARIARSISA